MQEAPFNAESPSLEALRTFSLDELNTLAKKIRANLIDLSPGKKAHLQSSLATVELSICLHFVFNSPHDKIVWDVGHQAYAHKWLTGRAEQLKTMRTIGGISGFPRRNESAFDAFGTGHSSTSISAIGGMAQADKILKIKGRSYIAVIGDGAITGGQSFEALNHMGALGLPLIILFNDNDRSLDLNVGALHTQKSYSNYFKSLGWKYCGPIDGHHIPSIIHELKKAKALESPVVLHVKTEHPRDPNTVSIQPRKSGTVSFSEVFGACMHSMAEENLEFAVCSPAMIEPAYLKSFNEKYPERCFDTGITEQHAVGFSAGMASQGLRVFCHLYSTFSQRAIDQIIHDVALQNLPVCFVLDRAGITGEDGPTHHGLFDASLFNSIPQIQIWDVAEGNSFEGLLRSTLNQSGPIAIRIPKSNTLWQETQNPKPFYRANKTQSKLGILCLGHTLEWLNLPDFSHFNLAVVQCLKPLPSEAISEYIETVDAVWVLEDGMRIGGLFQQLTDLKEQKNWKTKLFSKAVDDCFVEHGSLKALLEKHQLDGESLLKRMQLFELNSAELGQ